MTNTRMLTTLLLCLTLSATASAQYPLLTPEHRHDRMSLSSADHAATHARMMSTLQARLDSALERSFLLEERIKATLGQNQQPAGRTATLLQMTQNVSLITEALHALAADVGSLMNDESTVRDRAMQQQMEEIQLALGAIATENRGILMALEKTARKAPAMP